MRVGFLRVVFLLNVFSFAFLWLSESALAAKDESKYYQLHIPEQVVEAALQSLAKQVGKQLLFSHQSVDSLKSNAIKGRYTLPQALTQLLEGTGLSADQTDSGVIVITSANRNDYFGLGDDGMNSKKKLLASLVSFFVGSSGAVGVLAEEGVGEGDKKSWTMEEIVVTAQKREERLIDVPISISVVDSKKLKLTGIQSATDLSYMVPSLNVEETSPGDKLIRMRGVSNITGSSSLIGVYIDEIPNSLPGTGPVIDPQVLDIERIEVLKGPQGTLFGQGAVGGVIRYISKTPSLNEFEGEIGTSLYNTKGGDPSHTLTAIVNVPIIDDELAVRIAANYQSLGGWIEQIPTNKENVNDSQLSHFRIKGLWQVSEDLTIDASVISYRNASGAPNQTNTMDPADSTYRVIVPLDPLDPPFTNATDIDYDYDIGNILINYDFGFAVLTSSTSMLDRIQKQTSRSVHIPVPSRDLMLGQLSGVTIEADSFSQELRLAGGSDKLNWVVGAIYVDGSDLLTQNQTTYLLDDNLSPIARLTSSANVTTENLNTSTAIFSDFSYDFTEQLTASFGARYYENDKSVNSLFWETRLEGDFPTVSFDNLSLKASILYSANEETNYYFSVAEGFRSGGINFSTDFTPYDPEELVSYELGAKSSLMNRRLNTEFALFYSNYSEIQTLDNSTIGGALILNPGEAEIKGVEFSVNFDLSENISLGVAGDVIEAEFTEVAESPPTVKRGDSIPSVPEYSYALNFDYKFNWSSSVLGFAHLDYSRQGPASVIDRSRPLFGESESTGYLNAQIGFQWESLAITLFGKNINNELRRTSPSLIEIGAQRRPRTFGAELSYEF